MWEVSYCVRRADKGSLCLGDILLSSAIEEVRNRAKHDSHGASTYIWLVLAGGFSNVAALCLYLAHGFEIIGFYEVENEVLMAIRNVGDESTRTSFKQVKGKLESTFPLPVLKNAPDIQPSVTWMAPNDMLPPSSIENSQDSRGSQITEVSEVNSQQSSAATGKATAESELQGSKLEIQLASPQETQEDQFPHSEVSADEAAISEESPAATKVGDSPVEEEDEDDEVR